MLIPVIMNPPVDLSQPMGRGHPLPPPGTPLPMPEKKTPTAPIQVPRRKPIPPPAAGRNNEHLRHESERHTVPPPPLPKRRQFQREQNGDESNMLVVAAPADSEPTTPLSASHSPLFAQPWAGEVGGTDNIPLSSNPNATTVVDHAESEASSLAAVTENGQPGGAAETSEPAADDEDYSAWMDNDPGNPGLEEPDVTASIGPDSS